MSHLLTLALALCLTASACGDDAGDGSSAGDGRVRVVASFYPVAEAAEQVGGDLVEVANLTPAGSEPHDLELSPDQVDDLQDADVVLYLGGGFQPGVQEVAERREETTVDVLEAVQPRRGAPESPDPHFWLAPELMSLAVTRIEEALVAAAPEHAEAFEVNAARYREVLAELDRDFETALANCERRTIVTSHAAFHHLAASYDLEQLSISGLSPESEPDPKRLAELTDAIRDKGITTVFYETLVAPEVAQTLAREAGVEVAVLNPLEGLTEEDIEKGNDYVMVMRDNLEALAAALGCS